MAEARQVIRNMNLWRVRHDVTDGVPRLGSLDFLVSSPSRGNALRLGLFEEELSVRVTGAGEVEDDVAMPSDCHLVIANPPFTRAGGPGDQENTLWNPIFGSLLAAGDSERMKSALKRTLEGTPGSLYAGLGSAFIVLAHQKLRIGGRLAFVLPATMLTGSRWGEVRRLLLENYCLDWVVVSHDARHRSAAKNLPGRFYTSFSESTRMGETLIVATKSPQDVRGNRVRFVNLIRNPDEPVQAMTLTRKLLSWEEDENSLEACAIDLGGTNWGSVVAVPQREIGLGGEGWPYTAFAQAELALTAKEIGCGKGSWENSLDSVVRPCRLGSL